MPKQRLESAEKQLRANINKQNRLSPTGTAFTDAVGSYITERHQNGDTLQRTVDGVMMDPIVRGNGKKTPAEIRHQLARITALGADNPQNMDSSNPKSRLNSISHINRAFKLAGMANVIK